jgi:hypothetical protein
MTRAQEQTQVVRTTTAHDDVVGAEGAGAPFKVRRSEASLFAPDSVQLYPPSFNCSCQQTV